MNLDLFSYNIHQSWSIGYIKAVELAKSFWNEVFYRKAKAIFKNYNLKIECKKFYNLNFTTLHKKNSKKVKFSKKTLFFTYIFIQKEVPSLLL